MTFSGKILVLSVLLTLCIPSVGAQSQIEHSPDSVFKLVQADIAWQEESFGTHYRIVRGHARFFHNDTYFYCDSASWNVEAQQVFAYGNVQVVQDGTMLKSDQMDYTASDNTARFRGTLVELFDRDGNTLRTEWLDYNTKDSVALFRGGGAMLSRDSSVIESENGRYEAAAKLFSFSDEVEVYTDSIVISANRMDYKSAEDRIYFFEDTDIWREKGFVNADYGWYDRPTELIHFEKDVYMDDPQYEAWAQSVFYDRKTEEINMYDNAQVLDTARRAYYTADHILYRKDSVDARLTMSRDPVIMHCGTLDDGRPDTLYVRADSLIVYSRYKCDIPGEEVEEAAQRLEDITFDSLKKRRDEQAAERAKAAQESMRKVGKLPPLKKAAEKDSTTAQADSLSAPADTIASLPDGIDSTAIVQPPDTVPPPADSTLVRFLHGYHNMRAFRSDIQAACDSVVFCELDSIARMYGRPILWNEIKNQLTGETVHILLKDGRPHRASLLTDAWIISQVDTAYYHQIKSTEMTGFFHNDELYRYDALGGVNALFFMMDGDFITTANLKEAKSMSALIKDGSARRMLYNEQIKSDAYPVLELPREKMYLKDFEWRGQERPVSAETVTPRMPYPSMRSEFSERQLPCFVRTDKYFPLIMESRMPYIDSIE